MKWSAFAAVLIFIGINPASTRASGYTFTRIASLGVEPNFGDFEVGQINGLGQVGFVTETSTCIDSGFGFPACEGVFLYEHGHISQIVSNGTPAPGGGTFGGFIVGPASLNNLGLGAVSVMLAPATPPVGANAGLYRYSAWSSTLRAVVVPGVTPVPGSSTLKFQGTAQGTCINNFGVIAFPGAIPSSAGLPGTTLGVGIFTASPWCHISKIIIPGDPAPGGTFDYAENAWINDLGDVVFEAHLTGAECIGNPDHSIFLGCEATGTYLKRAGSQSIIKIAQQGDLDPSGNVFRHAWGPIINNFGQVLFVGDLTTPPDADQAQGLYLYYRGSIRPVVRPGDALPGGGALQSVSGFVTCFHLNNRGDVSFAGVLNGGDQGVYVRPAGGSTQLVVKTGTVIPGIGTFSATGGGFSGPRMNDRGQLAFSAVLASGETVLLVATPSFQKRSFSEEGDED